jgi:hypothetical protein
VSAPNFGIAEKIQAGRVVPLPISAEGLPGDMRLIRIDGGEFYSGCRHQQIKVPQAVIAAVVFNNDGCFKKIGRREQAGVGLFDEGCEIGSQFLSFVISDVQCQCFITG